MHAMNNYTEVHKIDSKKTVNYYKNFILRLHKLIIKHISYYFDYTNLLPVIFLHKLEKV